MDPNVSQTYRWRRRDVPKVRVTWIGLVFMLLMLIHKQLAKSLALSIGPAVLLFIPVVLIPVLALSLWRAGLLPPERVPVQQDEEPPAP